jgi:predicted MFS family arabinose efflux permease
MRQFLRLYARYKNIEKPVLRLIIAEFFLQLINLSFFLILNLYMEKQGYRDYQIADFVSYRFLAVMLLAFPLGMYIKGRKLRPFFYTGAIALPLLSLFVIYGVETKASMLLYSVFPLWGLAFTFLQVTAVPYILRNTRKENHSEAIALNHATWSISLFIAGIFIAFFNSINPEIFSEKILLTFFTIMGFAGVFFIAKMGKDEEIPEGEKNGFILGNYNWKAIFKAVTPTFIIAVGAGLTIPFINLFFYNVFKVDSDVFSMMGASTAIFVVASSLIVPQVKRRYGYKVAITLTQSLAVLALVILATTEYYSHISIAFFIAVLCYVIRQPLMTMAGPMTSELGMYYVGPDSREIMSALQASIWSGSWFISSQIFRFLRASGFAYAEVFFITAALYALGVILYYVLILDYYRKKEQGLILE